MRVLSIDTATMQGSVALTEGLRVVAQEQQGIPGTHSERLISSIDHLLLLAGWERLSIGGIAVAAGPGSFTGLRIGLATAQGMAMAIGCKVAGVSSLESLAMNGISFEGTVVPLIDARRGEIYAAAFICSGGKKRKRVMAECVLSPESLILKLKKISGPLLLIGDGAEALPHRLLRTLGSRAILAQGAQRMPQAANLAFLSFAKLEGGGGDNPSTLAPNYIRRSDAEIGFNRKNAPGSKPAAGGGKKHPARKEKCR